MHERDIALPLGSTPVEEPDEVVSCLQYAAALSPAFAISAGNAAAGTYAVVAEDPDVSFEVEVSGSVDVRARSAATDVPCLRGGAVELVEALSLRAPLPPSAPRQWRRLLGGLAATFDTEIAS